MLWSTCGSDLLFLVHISVLLVCRHGGTDVVLLDAVDVRYEVERSHLMPSHVEGFSSLGLDAGQEQSHRRCIQCTSMSIINVVVEHINTHAHTHTQMF